MKGRADTMKVPYSWLKEYVDIDISPEELQETISSGVLLQETTEDQQMMESSSSG